MPACFLIPGKDCGSRFLGSLLLRRPWDPLRRNLPRAVFVGDRSHLRPNFNAEDSVFHALKVLVNVPSFGSHPLVLTVGYPLLFAQKEARLNFSFPHKCSDLISPQSPTPLLWFFSPERLIIGIARIFSPHTHKPIGQQCLLSQFRPFYSVSMTPREELSGLQLPPSRVSRGWHSSPIEWDSSEIAVFKFYVELGIVTVPPLPHLPSASFSVSQRKTL